MTQKTKDIVQNKLLNKTFKFSSSLKKDITQSVIKKLGLKDKFQLNDKFEGLAFLDKHIRRVLSCKLIEELLDVNICSSEKNLKCSTDFEYKEQKVIIVTSNNLNKINFINNKFDYLILVTFQRSYESGSLKKIIPLKTLVDKGIINDKNIENKQLLSFDLSFLN
tara:strand:+ start:231 stop:725 length:495 start_codon:yes stop_codon:yes gene_type:complete